jgi:hypothetical protein
MAPRASNTNQLTSLRKASFRESLDELIKKSMDQDLPEIDAERERYRKMRYRNCVYNMTITGAD